jgi:hypothetical protein
MPIMQAAIASNPMTIQSIAIGSLWLTVSILERISTPK